MPSDLITLRPLAAELDSRLSGGRIDKITQPEADEIRLTIRNNLKNYNLVISCNPAAPRCHLTEVKKDNPYRAPAFCMHLRKYLSGCFLREVSMLEDRVFRLTFEGKNELKDNSIYRIYAEIMNRYSNIIFTNEEDTVTAAVKTVSFEESYRPVMSGLKYTPPSQDKISFNQSTEIAALLRAFEGGDLVGYLTPKLNGAAKITVEEMLLRSGYSGSLDEDIISKITQTADAFYNAYNSKFYSPALGTKKSDFYFMPYLCVNEDYVPYPDLNGAADAHFSRLDLSVRTVSKTKNLTAAVKKHRERLNKKLFAAGEKLAECEGMDLFKERGELITANIYRIKKGDTSVEVDNFFDPSYGKIVLRLDEKLSPQKNAEYNFNRYGKLKRAKEIVSAQTEEYRGELEYLATVEDMLSRAEGDAEIAEIEAELAALGALKARAVHKKEKLPPSKPYVYKFRNATIYAGKNNLQNEEITFKKAQSEDIWLHVRQRHGSHVVITGDADEEAILFAAQIAAALSAASSLEKAEVDYTLRKNVRRIKSKGPGMVNYTEYKTLLVQPDLHEKDRILK